MANNKFCALSFQEGPGLYRASQSYFLPPPLTQAITP